MQTQPDCEGESTQSIPCMGGAVLRCPYAPWAAQRNMAMDHVPHHGGRRLFAVSELQTSLVLTCVLLGMGHLRARSEGAHTTRSDCPLTAKPNMAGLVAHTS